MNRYVLPLILASILVTFSSFSFADEQPGYGSQVGNKALRGFANMTTAILEIPKNMINTTNNSNLAYGVFGGGVKGGVSMFGRLMVGVSDFITAPLPTKSIVQPDYIWEDFDKDTSFGQVYRVNGE